MIQDLHAHTYYSFCGKDRPEAVVEAAIAGGIELLGICDHNYGVGYGRLSLMNAYAAIPGHSEADYGHNLRHYYDHIDLVREKYADRIRLLRGIELCTVKSRPGCALPPEADVSFFDYCLVENLDADPADTITGGDIVTFAARCGCPAVGVAHTDLFALAARQGADPLVFFCRLAEAGVFWEMNVNYDTIHGHREHPYVLRFFEDAAQQRIVREAGLRLSIGFDGHRVEDYLPGRVADYCRRVTDMGIPLMFEDT